MNTNNHYQKIHIKDFLPHNIRLNLEKEFRTNLFNEAIQKAGTSAKDLAKELGYQKNSINCWRRGATKPTFKDLLKILSYLNLNIEQIWNNIISFNSQGYNGHYELPSSFVLNEKLAWYFGYRDGDGSKANPIIAACSSPKEIDLLLRYKEITDELIKTSNKWSIYTYSIKSALVDKVKETFNNERIISYSKRQRKEGFVILHIGGSKINDLFNNIEEKLDYFLGGASKKVQSEYAKGFFDADGHVDIHGTIILRQSIKGVRRIKRVQMVLDNLNIRYKTKIRSSKFTLIVYSLKDYKEKIGFNSEIKKNQLSKMIECYSTPYNPTSIENRVYSLCDSPITKRELMIKLKMRYGIMSTILNRMVNKHKLRVVLRRPFTVVNNQLKMNQELFY